MIQALNLDQRPDRARHEEDAHLDVDLEDGEATRLLFELKSAPVGKDYGTGRDTGMPQLQRWSTMHFAFAWFAARDNQPKRIWYGSPAMMRQWNTEQRDYLAPDVLLTRSTPALVDQDTVEQILGGKDEYTYADLHRLLKNQWDASSKYDRPNLYLANADVRQAKRAADCLYSPAMALQAVRDRVEYLLARGSTVNNRKISRLYVMENCEEITGPKWAVNLDRAVRKALAAEPAAAGGSTLELDADDATLAAEASLEAEAASASAPPSAPEI